MRNHVVLCGLGNIGFRVLEHLRKLGEIVIIVEKHEDGNFVKQAKAMKVPVVIGDIRFSSVLEDVNIVEAKCLIAATDDDLANLDAALTARAARDDIRVVLRMFDQELAEKVRDGFGIETAFSTSALAAPAFAMAAVDPACDRQLLHRQRPYAESRSHCQSRNATGRDDNRPAGRG